MDVVFCAGTVLLAGAIIMQYWDILRRDGATAGDPTASLAPATSPVGGRLAGPPIGLRDGEHDRIAMKTPERSSA